MRAIAFPMRLRENGLLERDSQSASLMQLLQVMARTPAGTWAACPGFGLRDLFENQRRRSDIARLAMERINRAFVDLGIADFRVTEIVREISAQRDIDTYSITISRAERNESFTTVVQSA
jgi:hypothetical protein